MTNLNSKTQVLKTSFKNGLIVSCQAPKESPLCTPEIIAALALCAEQNGAVGVRIDSPEHVAAVKKLVKIPVLGIYKIVEDSSEVYITPTFDSAKRIADAGADIIALDATFRSRPNAEKLKTLVEKIHSELHLPVMADVATLEEGLNAEEIGCDFVGTTLSGYTRETAHKNQSPDFKLVGDLAKSLKIPVVCEGRIRKPADVEQAFKAGAFTVVVGNAITGMDWLVREYVKATPVHQHSATNV
jgi:N-acylglucosamine-6-phosphate 2-epimerase